MNEAFRKISKVISKWAGSVWAFLLAISFILTWALTGPIFDFSNRWQLVVNTGTTVITFLMVFIIQNTQNRDNKAIHLKIDELIRAVKGARLSMMDAEELPDDKLELIHQEFKILNQKNQINKTNKNKDITQKEPIKLEPKKY